MGKQKFNKDEMIVVSWTLRRLTDGFPLTSSMITLLDEWALGRIVNNAKVFGI